MLEDVFNRYRIPFRFETGVPLLRVPFIKYWLSVLDLVTNDRSRDALSRVMASAYFQPRLSPEVDVDKLLAQFGYIDRHHLRASALAARKNSPLTPEIERFETVLNNLERTTDTVSGFMARLPAATPLTERDRQAWRVFSEEVMAAATVCDRFAPLTFAEFRRLASEIAALRTVDRLTVSSTAPGVPRVRIVHPHSLGSRAHRWIFAPGFCDGEFPARPSPNPLLSDKVVEAINTRIRPRRLKSQRDRSRREPLFLFMILDSATQRITLSYPASTLEGDPIYPSVYIGEIARHYAESPVQRSSGETARSDGEWKSRVAHEWQKGRLEEERARNLLGAAIVDRAKREAQGILRGRVARGTLPMDAVWHPSELNSLSSCPFVFLARHRLNIRESDAPDFEVPALEIGIFAHAILREFHSQPVPSSIDTARARMHEVIARRLSAADVNGQGPYSVFDPSLWKIRRRQLVAALDRYVDFAVRDAQDGFETKGEYLDAPLPAASLGKITLSGKPDHVAVRRSASGIDAIRVDDFKYSAASSATARQLKQSFQIPIYAYLAARAVEAKTGVRIDGRYLLLRSPENPVVSHAIAEAVFDDVRLRIEDLLHIVREGHLEPHPADRQGCIECNYRRLCRLYGG
jgi:ATP-dependent helicase/DNAse subunit B